MFPKQVTKCVRVSKYIRNNPQSNKRQPNKQHQQNRTTISGSGICLKKKMSAMGKKKVNVKGQRSISG